MPVIVDAVRAPSAAARGRSGGASGRPVGVRADGAAARNQLDPELIEDIVWGCVTQIADQSTNVGRLAVLAAGWPERSRDHPGPRLRVEPAGGALRRASVIAGHYDIVVAGGVESMSRVPLGAARRRGSRSAPG